MMLGPYTQAALRIGAGLLFLQHGLQKLFGMFGGVGPNGGSVPLVSQFGLAGVLETFGSLLIIFGLLTRPVALLLALEMLVAYFQVHFPRGGMPIQNRGEVPLLFMLVWLFFAGNGPGPLSLDARRRP
jgi:putative oxidoreductase